ncbi:opioid growth factor receptor conserved region-domain-containing protein [Leucosporidium creatinivorum]|uniref:Opioid growth factor receptor conserved region-domain-containing protein n=1 Tax=Leucosporidium creatinivorum TaxID=106004 RepID=A0A1Y2FZP9_9BASI|nr:opioid growth factor receptor conserved region-domain-containing protein [Leucosporidium creatinivorum]
MSSSASLRAPSALPRGLPGDIRQFLEHYPSQRVDKSKSANLLFYQNKGAGRPSRHSVEGLQDELRENYGELESSHSFIQWFFPIREQGMNWEAQPLQPHEIEGIKSDPKAMARRLESYKIMLDFYGMRLVDEETGQLARSEEVAPSAASWRARYANLTRNMHNFLRITRIMKSNSEFGQEHLNAPFLLFFLVEQERDELNSSSLTRSMDNYWRWCIRDDEEREFVGEMVEKVREGGGEWTEEMYVEALERRKKTWSFAVAEEDGKKEEGVETQEGEAGAKEGEGEGKRERDETEMSDSKKAKTDGEKDPEE